MGFCPKAGELLTQRTPRFLMESRNDEVVESHKDKFKRGLWRRISKSLQRVSLKLLTPFLIGAKLV